MLDSCSRQAATWLEGADALLVTTGAGMGVDSGLPDFRGGAGFWRAYPMYEKLGLRFEEAANPEHFRQDPSFGWGFYGHRLNLYRATRPHLGYSLIRQWAERLGLDLFVVTSNVDGQFQQASYSAQQIWEIHGSIHHLQCVEPCTQEIIENNVEVSIDQDSMRARDIPRCGNCGAVARPNILMFGDWQWLSQRSDEQEGAFHAFLKRHQANRVVVLEIGAGTALPTIRNLSEQVVARVKGRCVRINPRDDAIAAPHLSIGLPALESLQAIDAALTK